MNIGIFIGRMQPLHIWHQFIIQTSLTENDYTFIFLWGNNRIDANNPYSFKQRKTFIQKIFSKTQNYNISEVLDRPSDTIWVQNISQHLNNQCTTPDNILTFYWGDLESDSAFQAIQKNRDIFKNINKKIYFKEISRKNIPISSTLVRQALKNKNSSLLEQMLDKRILFDILPHIKN